MYTTFYGMAEKPFQITTDPRFLWLGEKHSEALANLKYGLMDRNGFVVLTGDVGTGKTTLVNALIDSLDDRVRVAKINHPNLETDQFLALIAKTLDPNIGSPQKSDLLIFFNDYLQQSYDDGKVELLIIDEAHRLSVEVLEEIRLLSNIEHGGQKLLNIFFVGQDEIKPKLQMPECRALRQRITSYYDIQPLLPEETRQYVYYRLKVSGVEEPLFDTEALELVYSLSKGNPRVINALCDRALLTGYVKGQRVIDADIVIECGEELELGTSARQINSPGGGAAIITQGRNITTRVTAGVSTAWKTLRSSVAGFGSGCRKAMTRCISTLKTWFADTVSAADPFLRKHHQKFLPAAIVCGLMLLFITAAMGIFPRHKNSQDTISAEPSTKTENEVLAATGSVTRDTVGVTTAVPTDAYPARVTKLPTLPVAPAVQESTPVEKAADALAQKNYQQALNLLEANPVGAANEDAEGIGIYAQALVGRAGELMRTSPMEAETLLAKATEVAPMMVEPHLMLGKRHTRTKDYPKAIDAYQKAIELDPKATDAFFNLGFVYAATGEFEAAEKAFEQVVALKPDYIDKSLFNLAVIQQKLGKKTQSIANLEEAVAIRPENERALAYLNQLRQSGTTDRTEQTR